MRGKRCEYAPSSINLLLKADDVTSTYTGQGEFLNFVSQLASAHF